MMFPATVVQAKVIFHELGTILPWADSQKKQWRGPGGTLVPLLAPLGSPALFITFFLFFVHFLQNQSLNLPWKKNPWEFMCSSAFKMLGVGSDSWLSLCHVPQQGAPPRKELVSQTLEFFGCKNMHQTHLPFEAF